MADYSTNAIVLKKTKLAETDLIITMLKPDGSQLRAVAKGARKPTSTFSSRLELFSNVDVLCAQGKNLDIIREVKLLNPFTNIRSDVERIACASPAVEFLARCTQKDMPLDDVYPLTLSFLNTVNSTDNYYYYKAYCAAHLIKTCCLLGFRPQIKNCAICGQPNTYYANNIELPIAFSYEQGGVICSHCARIRQTQRISMASAVFIDSLINSKFSEIYMLPTSEKQMTDALTCCKVWIILHLGIKLRSLDFYLKTLK